MVFTRQAIRHFARAVDGQSDIAVLVARESVRPTFILLFIAFIIFTDENPRRRQIRLVIAQGVCFVTDNRFKHFDGNVNHALEVVAEREVVREIDAVIRFQFEIHVSAVVSFGAAFCAVDVSRKRIQVVFRFDYVRVSLLARTAAT